MRPIPPKIASEFADAVYDVMNPGSEGVVRINTHGMEFPQHFDIDLSGGPIMGQSGGVFGLFRSTTGFAFLARGKGKFNGHCVVAMRGTRSANDWATNANIGFSSSVGGSYVHTGFNNIFESMRGPLEKLMTPVLSGQSCMVFIV